MADKSEKSTKKGEEKKAEEKKAEAEETPSLDRPAEIDVNAVAEAEGEEPEYTLNGAFSHEGKWYTRQNVHEVSELPEEVRKHHESAGHIVKRART